MTPEFDAIPNLERFVLWNCPCLEEIHPSFGGLERLVYLSISYCDRLRMCPPINRLKKLRSLSLVGCKELFNILVIQQQNKANLHLHLDNRGDEVASDIKSSPNFFVICSTCGCSNLPGVECCLEDHSSPHNNMKPSLRDNKLNNIGLGLFLKDLRDLNIEECSLGNEEICSAVWDLPNLIKLNLSYNEFSRLYFNRLRLPRLKWLDVSDCEKLVELSELPSSIAVVIADRCRSLESFGDISKCKWLWNISLKGVNNPVGDILLDSMLQGNAIVDYFINIILKHQIPKRFVGRLFRGTTFTLRLPDDWYNDFCGFLICFVVTSIYVMDPNIKIVIKEEVDEDSLFELSQESNELEESNEYVDEHTYVGYVSFGSLRHTAFSNSLHTMISVEFDSGHASIFRYESYGGVELIPRKSKGDQPQTTKDATYSSEFWDDGRPTFRIQDESKSPIEIIWQPHFRF
ncbi:hypothetical protein L1887_15404 [Cichorium endivia]|nr:hypothetical protein L1887_15404 [Cichorium endivia]